MSPRYQRSERVRAAIREVVAAEVERLKDPGLGFVTVTDVTLSPDLRHATVFYTVYSERDRVATSRALARATSHLRSAVARSVRLRFAPTLEFQADPIPERAARIDRLIAELHEEEAP